MYGKKIKSLLLVFYLPFLCFASTVHAVEWRMTLGAHDFIVEQADSHTFGAGVGLFVSHTTESSVFLSGRINTYFDIDNDELDPDHIPIWFQSDFIAEGKLADLSERVFIDWFVGLDDRRNTVSSVEKLQKLMPGVNIGWNNQAYVIGVNTSVGYYFLEVDDDVPRNRGYGRGGLRNETSAASVQVYTRIDVGENADLSISAQQWHDGDDWLENKYVMAFTYNAKRWLEGSWFEGGLLVFDIEHTEYNLDPYDNRPKNYPDYLPILPWDNDTFVRAYVDFPLNW